MHKEAYSIDRRGLQSVYTEPQPFFVIKKQIYPHPQVKIAPCFLSFLSPNNTLAPTLTPPIHHSIDIHAAR